MLVTTGSDFIYVIW